MTPTATTRLANAPAERTAPGQGPTRVMVCDDSATIRNALARMLDADPDIQVVSRASNGRAALDELARAAVEVLVLDIEMPVMDGMTALPLLLRSDPELRVIMASTLTTRGAEIAMQALRLGAADYIPKPLTAAIADDSFRRELIAKIKGLSRLRRRTVRPSTKAAAAQPALRPAPRQKPVLLAIGASTGGPQALFALVRGLGRDVAVPVVLTQHMPAAFTPILADHLTRLGGMPCTRSARWRAVADRPHLPCARRSPSDGRAGRAGALPPSSPRTPPENFCRPSVDPMLRSAVDVSRRARPVGDAHRHGP